MKKGLVGFVALIAILAASACGGGGGSGGSSNDLSCVPSTLSDPTVNLSTAELPPWTLTLTRTSTTCDYAPTTVTCTLDMTVTGNDVAISGTCESDGSIQVVIGGLSGKVSGDTLYWGGTLTNSYESYTETDTIPCNGVTFLSDYESETFTGLSITASWSNSATGDSGTCVTTVSGKFQ